MKRILSWPPIQFLREGLTIFFRFRLLETAACFAYFVLMTIFPVLICVSYVLGMANIDIYSVLAQMEHFLPDISVDTLSSYLRYLSYHKSPALFVAGLIACWFSSSAACRIITRVVSDVFCAPPRSLLRDLVSSILFPLGLLLVLILAVVVVVTGQQTLDFAADNLPFLGQFLDLWRWLRFVLLFAVFFLAILAVLVMASPNSTPRRSLMACSITATLALVVASGVFSWFIGLSSRYSLDYGSLVSIIILMLWLYICGNILFLAISFTGTWYRNKCT